MSTSGRLVIIREGYGEAQALPNLVVRTLKDLELAPSVFWSIPPSTKLPITGTRSAIKAAEIAALQDPAAVLLTADLDDGCPASEAPEIAEALRAEKFPFPIAVVFFYREFETLAISIAETLAGKQLKSQQGRPILTLDSPIASPSDPEAHRDAKGWISREMMRGVRYKPTVHQLPLTRLMHVEELRAGGLSSFRRLENALQFLAQQVTDGGKGVYPTKKF